MKKLSKRYNSLKVKVVDEFYYPTNAIKLLKELATAKFNESIEAHISLNINTKYADQQLRSTLTLPNGTGKKKKIAVLLEDKSIKIINNEKIIILNLESLIEKIEKNEINFDVLLTTPSMMPKIAKLGKILSSKGLMPSIKSGTITTDLNEGIKEFESGKFEYRADKTGTVHLIFGKANFSEEELLVNLKTVFEHIEKNKPSGIKGKFFKSFYTCTTMGPSVKIDFTQF